MRGLQAVGSRQSAVGGRAKSTADCRLPTAVVCLLSLCACNKPAPQAAPPRPVLSALAAETTVDPLALAGSVAARVETPFSFRVLGRLVSRPAQIGDIVQKDQTLASIDPLALQLGVRSAQADVASAQAQLANALGVAERQSALLKTNAATQAHGRRRRAGPRLRARRRNPRPRRAGQGQGGAWLRRAQGRISPASSPTPAPRSARSSRPARWWSTSPTPRSATP